MHGSWVAALHVLWSQGRRKVIIWNPPRVLDLLGKPAALLQERTQLEQEMLQRRSTAAAPDTSAVRSFFLTASLTALVGNN